LRGDRPVRQRRLAVSAAVFAGVTALGACGGSSGTHTQSFSPAPSDSSSAMSSTASSSSSPTSSFPTLKVAPAAQPAVDSYIALYTLIGADDRDPAHANLGKLNEYLTGQALATIVNGYINMKQAGLAYRGTAPTPRLRVAAVGSGSTVVLLANCPKIVTTDPLQQYNVNTGVALLPKTLNPPPPYLQALTMRLDGSRWKLSNIAVDSSKTCAA
jgi:hypothetical protein